MRVYRGKERLLRWCVIWVLALFPASAPAVDPTVDWFTLTTPHFAVHYQEGREEQAQGFARAAERAWTLVAERLGFEPSGTTEVVLSDELDYSQGYAQPYPYRLVLVHAVVPDPLSGLSDYDDWQFMLIAHELTHSIHIDTIVGLPALVNLLFGKILIPNGVQPRWFTEGLAVTLESALTGYGRALSPYSDMMIRTAVLEEQLFDLDLLSGNPWDWPQGTSWYIFGGAFVQYLGERFGENVWRDISHEYGSRLIPLAMNDAVERVTGHTYPELYQQFRESLRERYVAQKQGIEAAGRVEGERLTHSGQTKSPMRAGPDGTLYFVQTVPSRQAELVALAEGQLRRLEQVYGDDARLAVASDGSFGLLSQRETFNVFRSYNDLFHVDLESGKWRQLTKGLRVRDPDLSPDKTRVVFAKADGGRSTLCIAPYPALEPVETLVDLGPTGNVWTPRFSPDGAWVVFTGFAPAPGTTKGHHDIYLVATGGSGEGNLPIPVTRDPARDGGAVFSRDGEYILYHSDRDGVFNLYARPLGEDPMEPPLRVTRVLTGAFQPEPLPNGREVAYLTYGPEGFDIAKIALPPFSQLERVDFDEVLAHRAFVRRAMPEPVMTGNEVYPSEDYQFWRSVWPRSWLPLLGQDPLGTTVGVALLGQDALGFHSYALDVLWGIESMTPSFTFDYRNRTMLVGVNVSALRRLEFAPVGFTRNGETSPVVEDVWRLRAGVNIPLYNTRFHSLSASVDYELTLRHGLQPLRFDIDDVGVVFPDQGRFGAVRLGLSFNNSRSYLQSISPEEGGAYSINVRLEDPVVGSEYSAVSGTISATHYFENPFIERHVLAINVSAGYGQANYRQRRLFSVGGIPQRDLVLEFLNQRTGTNGWLRGFPYGTFFVGDVMVRGSVEYRLPILDIQAGYDTLPFFIRNLHGAVFLDGVAIADHIEDLGTGQHYTVGGELRLSLLLGYAIGATVRFGFGMGLGPDRDVLNWFLALGPVF